MAWGALATGARAATGSTGQGLSLMQESFSEITLAELPLVDLQHGARPAGLLPGDARRRSRRLPPHRARAAGRRARRVELAQLAFHLADKWRNPVLVYGDYLLAHTQEAVDDRAARRSPTLPAEGLGGRRRRVAAPAQSQSVTPLGVGKHGQRALGQEGKAQYIATKMPLMEREVRVETGYLDDAETVIVAFGSPAKFVQLRDRAAARRGRPRSATSGRSRCGRSRTTRSRDGGRRARARRRRSSCAPGR